MLLLLLLLLLLLPLVWSFNLDTTNYSKLSSTHPDSNFGTSLAMKSATILYVGAPNATDGLGELYRCDLGNIGDSFAFETLCNVVDTTGISDRDTIKGFGETMTLNPTTSKLVVCAPRRSLEKSNYCYINHLEPPKIQGICLEFDTADDSINKELDYCDRSNWETPVNGQGYSITFSDCLQVEFVEDGPQTLTVFPANDQSQSNSFDIIYEEDPGRFKITHNANTVDVDCTDRDGFGIVFKEDDPMFAEIFCKGSKIGSKIITKYNIYRESNLEFSLSLGFGRYWKDNAAEKDELKMYRSCLLGHSLGYTTSGNLFLSAPGFNFDSKASMARGALFKDRDNDIIDDFADKDKYFEKGRVYRSNGDWTAIGAIYRDYSRTVTDGYYISPAVIVLRNEASHTILKDDTNVFSMFGQDILIYGTATRTQLLVSAPQAVLDNTVGCGVVYIYTLSLTSGVFQKTGDITTESCGGFGYTLTLAGDLDDDGADDVIIGSLHDNAIHVVLGDSNTGGVQTTVSQSIKPVEDLKPYTNIFGFSVSVKDKITAISDPAQGNVYLYKTLPVLEISQTPALNCDYATFNIDRDGLNCTICLSLVHRKTEESVPQSVNMTLKTTSDNPNITVLDKEGSTKDGTTTSILAVSKDSCVHVTLSLSDSTVHNDVDLTNPLRITTSYSQAPEPETGREWAIAPATMSDTTTTLDLTSVCGTSRCEANFHLNLTSWNVTRTDVQEEFTALELSLEEQSSRLYQGSGNEYLNLNITITASEGQFIDETLKIELGGDFKARVLGPTSPNCSVATTSSSISLPVNSEDNICKNADIKKLGCDTAVSCDDLSSDVSQKIIDIKIPISSGAYTQDKVRSNITLDLERNSNLGDQPLVPIEVNITKIYIMDMSITFGPSLTNIKLRNYRKNAEVLQDYGPDSSLTLHLHNKGYPDVRATQLTVLYPVQYEGKEMMYVAEITSSPNPEDLQCSEDTVKSTNYRNLQDAYQDVDQDGGEKHKFLDLVECGGGWKCLSLQCDLVNFVSGTRASVTVTGYVNAEDASFYPNISLPLNTSRVILDEGIMQKELNRTLDRLIEVKPPVPSSFLYLLGSVAGGSFLLVVLGFILFKCGFFKRNRSSSEMRRKLVGSLKDDDGLVGEDPEEPAVGRPPARAVPPLPIYSLPDKPSIRKKVADGLLDSYGHDVVSEFDDIGMIIYEQTGHDGPSPDEAILYETTEEVRNKPSEFQGPGPDDLIMYEELPKSRSGFEGAGPDDTILYEELPTTSKLIQLEVEEECPYEDSLVPIKKKNVDDYEDLAIPGLPPAAEAPVVTYEEVVIGRPM